MRWWAVTGYTLSIAVHFGLAAGVGSIRKDHPRKPTTVKVFETKKKEKKKEEDKKEDKPPPPPKKVEAPPQPKNTPPPPTNATPTPVGHEAMAALPDFGISLSSGGEGGIAVPVAGITANAGAQRAAANAPTEKKVRGTAPKPSDAADACIEEPTKPKYRDRVQPQYPDSARSANVEGKIRIEVTINAEGDVTDARIIQGLGHGLDEAALVAMKRTKFHPSTKCGKPVATTIVIPVNFSLSD